MKQIIEIIVALFAFSTLLLWVFPAGFSGGNFFKFD